MTTNIKEIENEYIHGYITFDEMEIAKEKVENGVTAEMIIHPESKRMDSD